VRRGRWAHGGRSEWATVGERLSPLCAWRQRGTLLQAWTQWDTPLSAWTRSDARVHICMDESLRVRDDRGPSVPVHPDRGPSVPVHRDRGVSALVHQVDPQVCIDAGELQADIACSPASRVWNDVAVPWRQGDGRSDPTLRGTAGTRVAPGCAQPDRSVRLRCRLRCDSPPSCRAGYRVQPLWSTAFGTTAELVDDCLE
jgi:hypothetical protein